MDVYVLLVHLLLSAATCGPSAHPSVCFLLVRLGVGSAQAHFFWKAFIPVLYARDCFLFCIRGSFCARAEVQRVRQVWKVCTSNMGMSSLYSGRRRCSAGGRSSPSRFRNVMRNANSPRL